MAETSTWDQYLAAIKVSPGDIVDMHGLPVVLDLSRRPPGYRPGTYRCMQCSQDPYDPLCCRQRALPPGLRAEKEPEWVHPGWTHG